MAARITPRRGEVWLVDFDPTIGAEIKKTRPALIVQNDVGNRAAPTTIVAAITTTLKHPYPFQVVLQPGEGGLDHHSVVTLNHLRTIDVQRLKRRLGAVKPAAMLAVDAALLISPGIGLS
jgi:mRNA interferase MazF